jgi:methionine sulfoxide reductase catalytic subunit
VISTIGAFALSAAVLTMAQIIQRRPWQIPERQATPEAIFLRRRQVLKAAGVLGLGLAAGMNWSCGPDRDAPSLGAQEEPAAIDRYPARRNSQFALDRPLTDEAYAASYNNFYEFSVFKSGVYKKARRLKTSPWQIDIAGLVEKPRVFDIEDLMRELPLKSDSTVSAVSKRGRWPCRGLVFR